MNFPNDDDNILLFVADVVADEARIAVGVVEVVVLPFLATPVVVAVADSGTGAVIGEEDVDDGIVGVGDGCMYGSGGTDKGSGSRGSEGGDPEATVGYCSLPSGGMDLDSNCARTGDRGVAAIGIDDDGAGDLVSDGGWEDGCWTASWSVR